MEVECSLSHSSTYQVMSTKSKAFGGTLWSGLSVFSHACCCHGVITSPSHNIAIFMIWMFYVFMFFLFVNRKPSSLFSKLQGCAGEPDAAVSERQQRQPRLTHQWQVGGHFLQLQHRVQHGQASAGLPLWPPPLWGWCWRALQPRHQPVLWRLLLHVHSLPLRHPGPGAKGLQRWRLLQAEAPGARHHQQPIPHLQAGWRRQRQSGVPPRPGRHPGGDLHGAFRPGAGHRGRDQRAPADESVNSKRQEGPQLQDLQHQCGTLRKGRM